MPRKDHPEKRAIKSTRHSKEKRFEEILRALANLPGSPAPDAKAVKRCVSQFPELFKESPNIDVMMLRELVRKAWTVPDLRHSEWYIFRLRLLHEEAVSNETIRHAAVAESETSKYLEQLARKLEETPRPRYGSRPAVDDLPYLLTMQQFEPPPLTEFEEIFFHFQKHLHRALVCKLPECPMPYFFYGSKKGQEYCSIECAGIAKRKSNRESAKLSRDRKKKGGSQ